MSADKIEEKIRLFFEELPAGRNDYLPVSELNITHDHALSICYDTGLHCIYDVRTRRFEFERSFVAQHQLSAGRVVVA